MRSSTASVRRSCLRQPERRRSGNDGTGGQQLLEPLRTITTAHRGEHAVVAPTLVQMGYGERPGQAPRALDIDKPIGTLVGSQKHALVSAFMAKHYGGVVGHSLQGEPLHHLDRGPLPFARDGGIEATAARQAARS